jgi:hypothetical protein
MSSAAFRQARGCVRVVCVFLFVLVAGGCALTSSAHAQEWEQLHFSNTRETVDVAVSDGRRWAGYEVADRTARLINTETGSVIAVRPRTRCMRKYSAYGLVALGGGRALWHCRIPDVSSLRLYDMTRRRWIVPASPREPAGCDLTPEPIAVGRHWLSQTCNGNHIYATRYTNWRTGRSYRDTYGTPFPRTATSVADLDARGGQRRLCEPLRRSENPEAAGYSYSPQYFDYLFDGRRGIDAAEFEERLIVRACGGEILLSRPNPVGSVQLGGGIVSWFESDGYLRVFRFADQRGFEAPGMPNRDGLGRHGSVVHTRHAVYLSGSEVVNGQYTGRTLTSVAPLPPPLP